jgi:DNA-3-methyladenine glycosylase
VAGAVLIRALEPKDGIEVMIKNRKTNDVGNLTDGPAKLAMALNITKKQCGEDLVSSPSLYITNGIETSRKIIADQRVGIRFGIDKMWNFRI